MGLVMQDDNAHEDAPLSENLLEQFASYYLLSVLAVKAFEAARAHYAKAEPLPESADKPQQG